MKKNHKIIINLTKEQKEKIKQRAERSGLTLSSYALFLLLNTKPKIEKET